MRHQSAEELHSRHLVHSLQLHAARQVAIEDSRKLVGSLEGLEQAVTVLDGQLVIGGVQGVLERVHYEQLHEAVRQIFLQRLLILLNPLLEALFVAFRGV